MLIHYEKNSKTTKISDSIMLIFLVTIISRFGVQFVLNKAYDHKEQLLVPSISFISSLLAYIQVYLFAYLCVRFNSFIPLSFSIKYTELTRWDFIFDANMNVYLMEVRHQIQKPYQNKKLILGSLSTRRAF